MDQKGVKALPHTAKTENYSFFNTHLNGNKNKILTGKSPAKSLWRKEFPTSLIQGGRLNLRASLNLETIAGRANFPPCRGLSPVVAAFQLYSR